jgi:hypothetical protein
MPNFSAWVRHKLLEHGENAAIKQLQGSIEPSPVPKNYMCKHCLAIEDHWSVNCPTLEASK